MKEITAVKKHFVKLGYEVSLNKVPGSDLHILEYKDGPDPVRLIMLATYYFGDDVEPTDYGSCSLKLSDFNPEGHGEGGICKICGCTQNDACEDPDTGSCYWLEEDLCSACGSPEQRAAAMEEMRSLFGDHDHE